MSFVLEKKWLKPLEFTGAEEPFQNVLSFSHLYARCIAVKLAKCRLIPRFTKARIDTSFARIMCLITNGCKLVYCLQMHDSNGTKKQNILTLKLNFLSAYYQWA